MLGGACDGQGEVWDHKLALEFIKYYEKVILRWFAIRSLFEDETILYYEITLETMSDPFTPALNREEQDPCWNSIWT